MKTKRTRIKGKSVMVAWSNGDRVHVTPSQTKELMASYSQRRDDYLARVEEGYEWETDNPAMMRGKSRLMEELSDQLWKMDRHVDSLLWLLDAARELIDWDQVCIGPECNYYHRNLARFRYLVKRCKERCRQDPQLKPLLQSSSVYDDYLRMEQRYEGYKGLGWID